MAPKFTTRHYNAVADLFWIRDQELRTFGRPSLYQEGHRNEWLLLQKRFRNLFAGDNAGFKPEKFDRACGLEG
jgi:hypothetical protein